MLLRQELRRHGVLLEPYPLFSEEEGREFFEARFSRRLRLAVRAHREAIRHLDALEFGAPVALIQRQADVLPSLRVERLAAADRRVVWDVDDALWYDSTRFASGHRLAFLKRTSAKVRWLASRADHVIAANSVLASYLCRFTDRLTIVPSLIETRGIPTRTHANRDECVFGWIGSRSTSPYLAQIQDTLRAVSRVLSDRTITFIIVGGDLPPLDGVKIVRRRWTPETEREALARIDIGVVPQPDNIWTRGKSAYKAIQYMASGIPVIADDVGVIEETIGSAGLVVRDEREWLEGAVALARDDGLRAQLGQRGRQRAEERFSVMKWAPRVAAILKGED